MIKLNGIGVWLAKFGKFVAIILIELLGEQLTVYKLLSVSM